MALRHFLDAYPKASWCSDLGLSTCRTLFLDNQRGDPMTKPIPDKAEIALEYPDKLYVGTFERSSRFEAHLDPTGIALILERPGADDIRKSIHMHTTLACSPTFSENWLRRLVIYRRTTSCITINSRKRSPSCTRRWLEVQRNNDQKPAHSYGRRSGTMTHRG
jgi:hypothetical protein